VTCKFWWPILVYDDDGRLVGTRKHWFDFCPDSDLSDPYAGVAQMVEATGLDPVRWEFESLHLYPLPCSSVD
jgi:hypothetical protein